MCTPITTTAAADGGWRLMLPVGATIFLRATATNYVPFLRGFIVPTNGTIQDYWIVSRDTFAAAAASSGTTVDPAKGLVWVSFENATVAGYRATLGAAHDPPVTRAATTAAFVQSDATLAGDGDHWFLVFPNVPVGTTTIATTPPPGHHAPLRQPAVGDWLVRAGVVTIVEADAE